MIAAGQDAGEYTDAHNIATTIRGTVSQRKCDLDHLVQ